MTGQNLSGEINLIYFISGYQMLKYMLIIQGKISTAPPVTLTGKK